MPNARNQVSPMNTGRTSITRTVILTATAMMAFAANSLLCRLALGQGLIDAASFTSIRITAGAIILGLIICLFYLLKRLRLSTLSGNIIPHMRIVGTLSLAPRRRITLVEICDQWLLLGIGSESVTLVSKLDRPTETPHPCSEKERTGGGFHALLQSIGLRLDSRKSMGTEKYEKK